MTAKNQLTEKLLTLGSNVESNLTTNYEASQEHQTNITNYFNGFNVMLYLCLTNPKCSHYFDENKLESFNQLLQSTGITNIDSNSNPLVTLDSSKIITNNCEAKITHITMQPSNCIILITHTQTYIVANHQHMV